MRRPLLFTMRVSVEERERLTRVADRLGIGAADAVRMLVTLADREGFDPRRQLDRGPREPDT